MNINNKNIEENKLNEDIEMLSKNLYLESPDLWIDFQNKISDKKFDEMVLFFAIKYNLINIIQYTLENKLIDLNLPSKNNSFNSIKDHLIHAAKQNNHENIIKYILGCVKSLSIDDNIINNSEPNIKIDQQSEYIPSYICPSCNKNIFIHGYISSYSCLYKYSAEDKSINELSKTDANNVSCASCNNTIENTSSKLLENLCHIYNCTGCGLNLINIGIVDKIKMKYDNTINKFINNDASYHCINCDQEISEHQSNYFKL